MARKSTNRKSSADKFGEIVEGFCAALEKGVAPWTKPWNGAFGLPYNGASGSPTKTYNGINIFLLWAAAAVNGYADNRWYTFDQAKALCGFKAEWVSKKRYGKTRKVKVWTWAGEGDAPCEPWEAGVTKGQKGTKIIFAGPRKVEDEDKETGEVTERWFRTFKVWTVFNHHQITWTPGHEPKDVTPVADPEAANAAAAKLFGALPADIRHGGDTAAYSPKGDFIILPKPGAFESTDAYWSVRAHETVHWTGHRNRVGRPLDTRFGSEAYAFEELVAELGSAFLCAEVGITSKLQHAEYLASWVKVLRSDTKALFDAAREARKAVAWVKGDETSNKSQAAPAAVAKA
jgi:antirestriction protein ArdC